MHIPEGLRPHFKAIGILGVIALIGDAWLSVKFGWSISPEMAIIAGVISVASGLLLVAAMFFARTGWKHIGTGLAVVWCFAFVFNVWSNMGVSTANRMGEVQAARVQASKYSEQAANVAEAKRSLELFQKQLATLLEQNAWAGTVTADGLRAQVADLRKAEAAESRLGGCGQKCRGIQNQIAELQGRIGTAEQRSKLTEQIAATKRVIEKHRTTLADTDKGISNTANQSMLFAKVMSFNLSSDPEASMVTVANESTGIGFAVILAMIVTALTLAGAWPDLMAVSAAMLSGNLREQFDNLPESQPQVSEQSGNRTPAPRAYHHPRLETSTIAQLRRMAA